MYDLLITNALICDGTGSAPFTGDIAVAGERIAAVEGRGGNQGLAEALSTLDACGQLVVPGFIDVHAHSEYNVFADPNGESKLRQGVTTEINGNCGMSSFPLSGAVLEEAKETNAKAGVCVGWRTAAEYFAAVESLRPALNQASYVGHGNIRGCVMGMDDRPASPEEMAAMRREVEDAVEAGAVGFSTGLIYAPGMFAGKDELAALAKASGSKGGMYSSHIRGEGDSLSSASQEFFDIVREADCPAEFSHLKASGRRNWGQVAGIIERIEKANSQGGAITFDRYPYTASGTELSTVLPRWARDGGREAILARLQDPATRKKIVEFLEDDGRGYERWATVLLADSCCNEYAACNGKTIREIADVQGCPAEDICIDVLIVSQLHATVCNFTMSQEETDMAILHPLGMVCSDSEIRGVEGPLALGPSHPRAFGSFGKFFREYVKERALISLADAVKKTTAYPCEVFGFRDRGRLVPGCFADIVILDWDKFSDKADYAAPCKFCTGVSSVVVNGTITMLDGQFTGQRNGHVLRRNS